VAVEKTKSLETPRSVQEGGLLGGAPLEALHIGGQLAAEEAPGVATMDNHELPTGQRRLCTREPQRIRR
jgi:hypothetical protein